jgi:hypothetical protein
VKANRDALDQGLRGRPSRFARSPQTRWRFTVRSPSANLRCREPCRVLGPSSRCSGEGLAPAPARRTDVARAGTPPTLAGRRVFWLARRPCCRGDDAAGNAANVLVARSVRALALALATSQRRTILRFGPANGSVIGSLLERSWAHAVGAECEREPLSCTRDERESATYDGLGCRQGRGQAGDATSIAAGVLRTHRRSSPGFGGRSAVANFSRL